MPIYEFLCPNDHRFEKYAKMSESDKPARCPQCKKKAERVYSNTGAPKFKAGGVGGFYAPTKD